MCGEYLLIESNSLHSLNLRIDFDELHLINIFILNSTNMAVNVNKLCKITDESEGKRLINKKLSTSEVRLSLMGNININ